MKLKTRCFLLISALIFLFLILTVYFFDNENVKEKHAETSPASVSNKKINFISEIKLRVQSNLKERRIADLFQFNSNYERKVNILVKNLKSSDNYFENIVNKSQLWKTVANWVNARELFPEAAPELPSVLKALSSTKITNGDLTNKGTQLKLKLRLKGGQSVFFKPKRYNINELVRGTPYAGYDRHNGEIAAFQLSRLLGMRNVPICAGRRVHVQNDVRNVASQRLLRTFLSMNNSFNGCSHSLSANICSNCFYGDCYYCSENRYVCPDENGYLDGVVILLLPENRVLQQYRNPWQRTYRKNVLARWEQDPKYCLNTVMKSLPINPRILDLIDAAVFDYLIGNADRHHYEVFKDVTDSAVLFFDNGKSFGNPYWDEFTILAPLYQCCFIRKSTYERLLLFAAVRKGLSGALNELLFEDVLYPVLSDANLEAIDRRLKTVVTLVNICLSDTNKVLF